MKNELPFYCRLYVAIPLLAGIMVCGILWDYYAASHKTQTNMAQVSAKKPASNIRFVKIQDVQVGERSIGKNPELTVSERSSFLSEPEPATWRKLTLEMIKPDGKRLDITLLRPLTWLEDSNAQTGNTIYLDLPEMGAQGQAKVLNVEPCPPIKPGKGNVITGTFHHEAANVIDIYVEGLEKPIGTTDNHPFWSATKNEFVEAGKLLPGEELQLYNGQTAKVVQTLPRPGPQRVHNLEILNEHVYYVAQEGVLVHNQCAKNNKYWNNIQYGGNLKKLSKQELKNVDEHSFKKDILGSTSKGISEYNISIDKDTKQIYLTPVKKGESINIPTDYKLGDNGIEPL